MKLRSGALLVVLIPALLAVALVSTACAGEGTTITGQAVATTAAVTTTESAVAAPTGDLYVAKAGDQWGYIDQTGAWVIEPQFNAVQAFSEGVAVAQREYGGEWGYIDKTGALVVEPQFDSAEDFSEGLAAVAAGDLMNLQWGYIDTTGSLVIEPQFLRAAHFSEGLAAVEPEPGGYFGFIDQTGSMVIQPKYFDPGLGRLAFSGGLALVGFGLTYEYIDTSGTVIWQSE